MDWLWCLVAMVVTVESKVTINGKCYATEPWGGVVLVGNCSGGELPWCMGIVLVRNCSSGDLTGWESSGWDLTSGELS